jgi:anti-sigma factor RsiW
MRHEDAASRLPELVGLREAVEDDAELNGHVARCARCRRRLRGLRKIDSDLSSLDPPTPPSPRLERRILAIPAAGAPEVRRPARRRLAVVAACAVVLLIGGLIGALATRDQPAGEAGFVAERTVRLVAPGRPVIRAQVEIGAPQGSRIPMRVVATGLPHGAGRYYGLWLTGADGAVSGGAFRPDGAGRCVVMLQVPAGVWTGVDITAGDRPPSTGTTVAGAGL